MAQKEECLASPTKKTLHLHTLVSDITLYEVQKYKKCRNKNRSFYFFDYL